MNKRYVVTLTDEERRPLRALISSGKGSARKLTHARILLKADTSEGGPGWIDAAISESMDVGTATVERVRKRFVEEGVEAALVPRKACREYKRNGVANLFMVFEPLAGKRRVKVTERRTKKDWAECVRELVDEMYPEVERIVLVMDNLNTHTPASLYEAFVPDEAKRLADRL